MVFSSSTFLFVFMPLFFVVYFLLPARKAKNILLLLASLFFYAWGEPVYVVLLAISIIANWAFGLLVRSDKREQSKRKTFFVLAIIFNCLVIGFFKYEGFVATNVNALLGTELIPNLELPLPIGISFYTLQALSYVIDVYRKEVEPQRNIAYLGMYIACFPQLIAGPIVRYQTIQEQVLGRKETLENFASGARLFIVGLTKKCLLANTVALLADQMLARGGTSVGVIGAWGGLIAYTFQIYFDFGGYSDMAIGLGRMMGFTYLRNFNYPYISRSITEFWHRWHSSLSTFFRDYVYIPLGGSHVSRPRWVFNIAVVWAITGLWHGAAWNYVLWGVYYGVLLIAEKLFLGRLIERLPAFLQHMYVITIFVFGWSFFWITDPEQLIPYWKALVGAFGVTGTSTVWELTVWEYWPVFLICVIASTPIAPFVKERIIAWLEGRRAQSVLDAGIANPRFIETPSLCTFDAGPENVAKDHAYRIAQVAYDLILLALFVASVMSIVSGSFNPFIYFQF